MKKVFQSAALSVLGLIFLGAAASSQAAVDSAGLKVVRMALSTEPPNLNAMKATDQVSFFVLGHVMEGLTRYGEGAKIIPGVAESWKTTPTGMVFKLRSNALWSDGKPVVAKDFVFGWRTALDPKMASEYAFILYPIKNAEAINQGKMAVDKLGVVAKDDFTLEVTFERPTAHFLTLTPFATYYPVREDVYQQFKDRFAAEANTMIYNGPFVLTHWLHGASLQMDKNQKYWNAKNIKIDRVDIPYITNDNSARFNFFKDKKTDVIEALAKDDLPKAQSEKFKMQSHLDGSLWFMEFNFLPGRPTANLNLRKAIAYAFEPAPFVNKVVGIPGTKAAQGLIPSWLRGSKDLFRKEYPLAAHKPDLALAKKHLELAKKELGGSIPSLIWLTGDSPGSSREAEYFQSVFKTKLGIDLKIDKQIFKQRLAKMTKGEFDIVSAGWGPDYADPMTFADLFTSWNENNRGRYANANVDRLIREAQTEGNAKKRMDLMAQAEKIVLEELAILPTYEKVVIWTQNNRVKGVARNSIGPDPDFSRAEVVTQ